MARINEKIDRFQHDLRVLSLEALNDDEARKTLLGVVQEGMATLEAPIETIWRLIMIGSTSRRKPHQTASLMTVVKMGLVSAICQTRDPVKADQLAKTSGCEKLLIVRLMRPLTALGIFKETDVETYTSTPISHMLVTPPLMGGFQFVYSAATRSLANLPFCRSTWTLPASKMSPVTQGLSKTPTKPTWASFLAHCRTSHVDEFQQLHEWAKNESQRLIRLLSVDDILFKDANFNDSDATLLVDIAGSEGHNTEAFHKRYPTAPGKLVLQYLPATIDNVKQLDGAVVRMNYNFFMPQPVQGATAYYFRSIFHDWPDRDCINIVKNTAAAMKKGYSKLLIFEWILPDRGTPLYPALLDIKMMALLNGMERNRGQWIALLAAAGLNVIRFWTIEDDVEGLIEAELM